MSESVVPFGLEELHLMGHGVPLGIKVKINICTYALLPSLIVSEMLGTKDGWTLQIWV
jgi:hypothetical protein